MPSQKYSKKCLAFSLLLDCNDAWTGFLTKYSEFDLSSPSPRPLLPYTSTFSTYRFSFPFLFHRWRKCSGTHADEGSKTWEIMGARQGKEEAVLILLWKYSSTSWGKPCKKSRLVPMERLRAIARTSWRPVQTCSKWWPLVWLRDWMMGWYIAGIIEPSWYLVYA